MANQSNSDTMSSIKDLEERIQGMSSVLQSMSNNIDDMVDVIITPKSPFFDALTKTMMDVEVERWTHDEAIKQNEETRKMSNRELERGDKGFWEAAFAPMQKTLAETQTDALKATFSDKQIQDLLKETLHSSTINEALKSSADSRTFGEKTLDALGLGGINKAVSWFKDRGIRKEEKATAKDQGEIKREQKAVDRLKAKYRSAKKDNASEDELNAILEDLRGHQDKIKAAEGRIDERRRDPFADLVEKEGGLFGKTLEAPGQAETMERVNKSLEALLAFMGESGNAEHASVIVPNQSVAEAVSAGESGETKRAPAQFADTGKNLIENKGFAYWLDKQDANGKEDDGFIRPGGRGDALDVIPEESGKLPRDGKTETDKREQADIQKNLDTKLRPDFYRLGTEFFQKYLDFDPESLGSNAGGSGLGKGGLYAAAGAAVAASVFKLAEGGAALKEWFTSSRDRKQNINTMYDNTLENNEKMKKGWNDDMRDALAELTKAQKDLDNTIFFDGKEKEAVEKARERLNAEKQKMAQFQKAAREAGVNVHDDAAMNKFKEEYDIKHKSAAGNIDQYKAPTAQTPGAELSTGDVETAEEKAKREEETMYQATRRAMLDPDVRKLGEENAKQTGKQINESLVGRK